MLIVKEEILTTRPVTSFLLAMIQDLDLTLIRNRFLYKHGWSTVRVDEAIAGYRYYLYFTQLYNAPVAPTPDIDAIWHEHLIHTEKYASDCQSLFGSFLHHLPKPVKADNGPLNDCCNTNNCCNDGPGKTATIDLLLSFSDNDDSLNQREAIPYEEAYAWFLK